MFDVNESTLRFWEKEFDQIRPRKTGKGTRSYRQEDIDAIRLVYHLVNVLGMTKHQIFFKVKLLQMVKRIVPPMSNEIITLVKDTSLARIIALQEIIWAGQAFLKGSQGISGAIWPMFFTAFYYLIFNGILTVLLGKLEKKLEYFN